jgi:hypothetical protein
MFINLLSSIDADALHAVHAGAGKETPSLLALGKEAASKDARRGLATAVRLLNVLGAALSKPQTEKNG